MKCSDSPPPWQRSGGQPFALQLPHTVAVRLGEERLQGAGHRPLCRAWRHGRQATSHHAFQEVHLHR